MVRVGPQHMKTVEYKVESDSGALNRGRLVDYGGDGWDQFQSIRNISGMPL